MTDKDIAAIRQLEDWVNEISEGRGWMCTRWGDTKSTPPAKYRVAIGSGGTYGPEYIGDGSTIDEAVDAAFKNLEKADD